MEKILDSMKAFADAANDINQSSHNQAELLKQIEGGIEQISEVVQSNSASAQETSAMSEEVSTQAGKLDEAVAIFVLKEE